MSDLPIWLRAGFDMMLTSTFAKATETIAAHRRGEGPRETIVHNESSSRERGVITLSNLKAARQMGGASACLCVVSDETQHGSFHHNKRKLMASPQGGDAASQHKHRQHCRRSRLREGVPVRKGPSSSLAISHGTQLGTDVEIPLSTEITVERSAHGDMSKDGEHVVQEDTVSPDIRCLRINADVQGMRSTAQATLEQLETQGEQLQRALRTHERMQADVQQGNRQLGLMEAWFGWLPRPWGPSRTPATREVTEPENSTKESQVPGASAACAVDAAAGQVTRKEPASSAGELDEVVSNLRDLKGMARGIGAALDEQNDVVKELSSGVDASKAAVAKATARADRL